MAKPIPSQLTHDKYKYGTRDYSYIVPNTLDTIDIKDIIKEVTNDTLWKYSEILKDDLRFEIFDNAKRVFIQNKFNKIVEEYNSGEIKFIENLIIKL